ncbi:hypothetical protein NQ317_004162 [Molorchus minor]|uniref:Uncharacterized protein n=1 Tax=Molorchus minor TaxID=1323400 RepID=A0ABQ9JSG3_9CUCU|nr:hypothetical protein NQ317_004162 [Molorchus minor]
MFIAISVELQYESEVAKEAYAKAKKETQEDANFISDNFFLPDNFGRYETSFTNNTKFYPDHRVSILNLDIGTISR